MNFFIFKTAKPKRFAYKPRYYDPEKYERELRREKMGLSPNQSREERIRAQLHYEWDRKKERRAKLSGGILKMFLYLGLIVALLLWILK
ncbi:MAG: hypothetical protein LBH92_00670 [Bacteroidales bacterium]|jgi:hypothetical protein|nr:hypothetical protein [Bacteroidales bacterium]